jgi:[ribosomal protein S18]-alanine N-acetyltransferase
MPIHLRPEDAADFEALYAIDRACYPRGIAYSRRTLRWFLRQPGTLCLVAVSDLPTNNRIVGFIIAEANGSSGHMITLDVSQSHRRAGVGSVLLRECERRLAAQGVCSVSLETAITNESAVAFWQAHGYRSFGTIPRYYLGRLDAYAMRKILTLPATSEGPQQPPSGTAS